jgi:hypothetical protein
MAPVGVALGDFPANAAQDGQGDRHRRNDRGHRYVFISWILWPVGRFTASGTLREPHCPQKLTALQYPRITIEPGPQNGLLLSF